MKKSTVSPLALDKETIGNLDEQELSQIAGGVDESTDGADEECYVASCGSNSCNATKTKAALQAE
ncbi:hypothetical protein F5984_21955 [Rudanella paleaurantiibacter]|uniref:Uncharacterized protein n=1 Tax=Rudanella paleaurantiibacter TaxID=2614655 RepID=A0A7J5TTS9_9BACT|nr:MULTISPECIES: class I lanthipeptide [Rudanella]KAB7727295.1 hypothetical protein F5984_21955 [Rudanella paleaurantiibacter]